MTRLARPSELAFSAIRIEGDLLAADFLYQIAHFAASEQSEADYDTPKGLRLRDEIGRYYKIAQNLWQDFQPVRGRGDVDAHAATVREFLEPFCRHVLCFGDLHQIGSVHQGERLFPIGFQALGGQVPLVFAAHDQALEQSPPISTIWRKANSAALRCWTTRKACASSTRYSTGGWLFPTSPRAAASTLLGNPPWERIKLQEEEFFASRSPLVAEYPHKAERAPHRPAQKRHVAA